MTITIDKVTLARIRKIAGARGVSRFIAEAARERAGRSEVLALLAELDAKFGRPSPEMLAATDRELREHFGMAAPTQPWSPYTGDTLADNHLPIEPQPARAARPHRPPGKRSGQARKKTARVA